MSIENVQIFKLTTGEELIAVAQVEQPQPDVQVVKLIRPCVIFRIEMPDGMISAKFAPAAPYVKDHTITISPQHVVYVAYPEDDFARAYDQLVNPNAIITPPEKKLIVQ